MRSERSHSSRPERTIYRGIGDRTPVIGTGSSQLAQSHSIGTVNDGRSIGIYGLSKYGRCKYGMKRGIYGSDKYGSAAYW